MNAMGAFKASLGEGRRLPGQYRKFQAVLPAAELKFLKTPVPSIDPEEHTVRCWRP